MKWEYLTLEVSFMGGKGHVQQRNGEHLEPSFPKLIEYLSQLGEEGWEMVATWSGGGGSSSATLFFKRKK
jgi:hypothetical protein